MSSKRRLSQSVTPSAGKLRLDSINKILKIDSSKKRKDKLPKQISKVALAQLLKDATSQNHSQNHELPDFKEFLNRPENVELFHEFLKTQYCQENIDFYLACEKYRKLDHNSTGNILIQFNARQIFNDYLSENAKQPVNVNADCITTIQRNLNQPTPYLFRDAQQEVFNLMRSDCYPRFCKTYKMDEGTARKILQTRETPQQSFDQVDSSMLSQTHLNSTAMSSQSNCTFNSRSSASAKVAVKRKLQNLSNLSYSCPSNCPYYRLGLPCQTHCPGGTETSTCSRDQSIDLIDQIKLSKIHHVPKRRPDRTPPPPPVPPKYQPVVHDLAAPSLELPRPISRSFVGKVYHV